MAWDAWAHPYLSGPLLIASGSPWRVIVPVAGR